MSVLREDFGPESDVDVLVELAPDAGIGLLEFVALQRELGEILWPAPPRHHTVGRVCLQVDADSSEPTEEGGGRLSPGSTPQTRRAARRSAVARVGRTTTTPKLLSSGSSLTAGKRWRCEDSST